MYKIIFQVVTKLVKLGTLFRMNCDIRGLRAIKRPGCVHDKLGSGIPKEAPAAPKSTTRILTVHLDGALIHSYTKKICGYLEGQFS